MNVLLIIDPQIDFISGTLAVPGATEAMDFLTRWVEQHEQDYDAIVVTMDQHPADHCSFDRMGGPWPPHCVRYTYGAAIYPPLAELLGRIKCSHRIPLLYIPKAMSQHRDSYSAFADTIPELLIAASRIDVAGLAGDYCVKNSIQDIRRQLSMTEIHPLDEGIAWIGTPEPLCPSTSRQQK